MEVLRLIVRNVFRHRLRAALTILGVAIAMLSFGILSTLVAAWYGGVEASAANRLVTRNKISLIYSLPLAYRQKILHAAGVTGVAHGTWYGGIYKDKKNFFAQFAVSGVDYINLFPELLLSEPEKRAFDTERNGAVAGKKLAERFGWKLGEIIPLQGTIFPGNLEVVLRGIYRGARHNVDETAFFFRFDYLNEQLKKTMPERADRAGWYMVRIKEPEHAAEVSRDIDALFENSLAETLTETEKAFQLGFVAMTEAIVVAIRVISVVVIIIILIVLANTMAMTARERSAEYAALKTLGFGPGFIFQLIAGESVAIAVIGGVLGAVLCYPVGYVFAEQLRHFIPVFQVAPMTLVWIGAISCGLGLIAAFPPAFRVSRTSIAEGLRHIG